MKNKIPLNTERMKGFGPYVVDSFEVNYLYGLNELCEKYVKKDFTILELGSNDGVSASLFSYFADRVICVDLKKTKDMDIVISENKNIVFHKTSFENFLSNDYDNKYDLIYIDGGHDFKNINKDIELFKNKVKKGGYISGHDFNSETNDVGLAVKNHFPNEEIMIFSDSSWLVKIK